MADCDFLIIGAGMAGASLAYRLAGHGRVRVIERENHPAYHTTGRSAAFYMKSYGHPNMRPFTIASREFFDAPPAGFTDAPLLRPRGSLVMGRQDRLRDVEEAYERLKPLVPEATLLDGEEVRRRAPMMRPEWCGPALFEPATCDIDVDALHQGFLRGARRQGVGITLDAGVRALDFADGEWRVETGAGRFSADVIVNAAGAWADEIAGLAQAKPLGLVPKRRTVITFPAPQSRRVDDWPLILDIGESFYFKPESGHILASPSDETPMPPSDVQPEEEDIAITAARIEAATTLRVERVARKWAGLRTFTPDDFPAVGFDPGRPQFFWLAGQGGAGIQTAPMLSEFAAALVLGQAVPPALADLGVNADTYSPARFSG